MQMKFPLEVKSTEMRNLIHYLPQYMQEYSEIQKIMEAEQPEINLMWQDVNKVWANQFLLDATIDGVERWENMLHILPKSTDTLDERKFRILSLWNQELPYTYRKLEEILTTLCGAEGYSIVLDTDNYYIQVILALDNISNVEAVENLLHKMIPVNMTSEVSIMYNIHDTFIPFTHSALHNFTHEELRSDDFT